MPCSRRHWLSLTRAASCAFDVPDDAEPPDDAASPELPGSSSQAASAAAKASTAKSVRNRGAKDMGASFGVVAGRSGRCTRTSSVSAAADDTGEVKQHEDDREADHDCGYQHAAAGGLPIVVVLHLAPPLA